MKRDTNFEYLFSFLTVYICFELIFFIILINIKFAIMKKCLLFILFGLGISLYAQMSGTEGYITNGFVEVGIHGTLGCEGARVDSVNTVPAGYHFRSNNQLFGFNANPQMDGWIDYNGDFFTPGTPENGWGLLIVTSTDTFIFCNNNANAMISTYPSINGSIVMTDFTSACKYIIWKGNYLDSLAGIALEVEIKYELCDSNLYYSTTTTITNNGDTINDFYYLRNIDPDNNVMQSGDYSTVNIIVQQPTPTSTTSIVTAEQSIPYFSIYALIGNDSLGQVMTGGFSNRNPLEMLAGIGGTYLNTVGDSTNADDAISYIQRKQNFVGSGTFRAGENVFVSTIYSVFDADIVENAQVLSNPLYENQFVQLYYNTNNQNLILNHANGFGEGTTLTIYNQLGQVIYTFSPDLNSNNSIIPMANFASSVYIATITGNNLNESIKFVK